MRKMRLFHILQKFKDIPFVYLFLTNNACKQLSNEMNLCRINGRCWCCKCSPNKCTSKREKFYLSVSRKFREVLNWQNPLKILSSVSSHSSICKRRKCRSSVRQKTLVQHLREKQIAHHLQFHQ